MQHTPSQEPLPLSVALICCDNERTIGRTLDSVKGLARQIVAIDSGSSDGTIELLRCHDAVIRHQQWLGHVRQKQLALDACEQPWILCLDSDEALEPDLRDAIRRAILEDDPAVAAYEVNRKIWWHGAFLNHAWQPEWRLRLVRRHGARWAGYDPHDQLELLAPLNTRPVRRLQGDLRHESFFTMAEYLEAQVAHARVGARSLEAIGRRGSVRRLLTSPVGAWLKQMVIRQAWRDGWRGWSAASATAVATLMKHLILLEMTRSTNQPRPVRRQGPDA